MSLGIWQSTWFIKSVELIAFEWSLLLGRAQYLERAFKSSLCYSQQLRRKGKTNGNFSYVPSPLELLPPNTMFFMKATQKVPTSAKDLQQLQSFLFTKGLFLSFLAITDHFKIVSLDDNIDI